MKKVNCQIQGSIFTKGWLKKRSNVNTDTFILIRIGANWIYLYMTIVKLFFWVWPVVKQVNYAFFLSACLDSGLAWWPISRVFRIIPVFYLSSIPIEYLAKVISIVLISWPFRLERIDLKGYKRGKKAVLLQNINPIQTWTIIFNSIFWYIHS